MVILLLVLQGGHDARIVYDGREVTLEEKAELQRGLHPRLLCFPSERAALAERYRANARFHGGERAADAVWASYGSAYVPVLEPERTERSPEWGSMRAERYVVFVREPGYFVIADVVRKGDAEHDYDWLLHTDARNEVAIAGDRATITGARRGNRLVILALDGGGWVVEECARVNPDETISRHKLLRRRVRAVEARFLLDGSPCGFVGSIARNILLCIALVELIVFLVRPDHRRLGDLVAGTRVEAVPPQATPV